MLALIAFIIFVVALFVTVAIDLVTLGLAFLTLHFVVGDRIGMPWGR